MLPDPDHIRFAFLEAMAQGYAGTPKETTDSALPGSSTITFQSGDYRVMDRYFTTALSDKSAGQTTIWFFNQPVWIMSYGGHYERLAIPFLKQCLRLAYVQDRRFYGGRGPLFVRDARFTYVNGSSEVDNMTEFSGKESIFDVDGRMLGYHWYHGMSLLK